jgi:hypothetical protein
MIILNKKYKVILDKNKKLGNLTKRGLSAFSIPFYRITTSNEYNYTFFLIPKTGISTILATLRAVSEPDIDELTVIYNHLNHLNKFKFCFIRNPWDRLVSCYSNKVLRKKLYPECWHKDFEYFVNYLTKQHLATSEGHIRLQSSSFPTNGVDYIGRFENFKQDFDFIINEKLKLNKELIKKNPSKHRNYTSYYNDRTRKIVEELYKSDIEVGNYKFGE